MRRTHFHLVAAVSCALGAGAGTFLAPAHGASRPRYGGTLRVKVQARLDALEPRHLFAESGEQNAAEKLLPLVFDRLVSRDASGRPQPQLATSWTQDAAYQHWEFRLRPGAKFSDGTLLTAEIAAHALENGLAACKISASVAENVVIDCAASNYDLLQDLAEPRNSISRRTADGTLTGTGPFRVAEWQAKKRAVLKANENDWRGRPFLDAVEVEMGVMPREQVVALELGKADVIEIVPEDARRVSRGTLRTSASLPNELLAIVFQPGRPAAVDAHVREALARSIDRATIHAVLLQKQGELAGGLLPQWLSGYAFLFSPGQDLARSRELVAALPAASRKLTLEYAPGDSIAGAIAERIAVNARDAGLALQTLPQTRVNGQTPIADARLMRLHIEGLEPGRALGRMVTAAMLTDGKHPAGPLAAEVVYAEEFNLLEGHQIIPLFHLPQIYGLSARVKNWSASTAGEWRLGEIWVEAERP